MSEYYKKHVFICTKCKYEKDSDPAEAAAFRQVVKKAVKETHHKNDVRVNASGCLGHCSRGINAVIYPEGKWLHNLTPEDKTKILVHLN